MTLKDCPECTRFHEGFTDGFLTGKPCGLCKGAKRVPIDALGIDDVEGGTGRRETGGQQTTVTRNVRRLIGEEP
jgi:hypothetical protein